MISYRTADILKRFKNSVIEIKSELENGLTVWLPVLNDGDDYDAYNIVENVFGQFIHDNEFAFVQDGIYHKKISNMSGEQLMERLADYIRPYFKNVIVLHAANGWNVVVHTSDYSKAF